MKKGIYNCHLFITGLESESKVLFVYLKDVTSSL